MGLFSVTSGKLSAISPPIGGWIFHLLLYCNIKHGKTAIFLSIIKMVNMENKPKFHPNPKLKLKEFVQTKKARSQIITPGFLDYVFFLIL
jgi:hypothetical protein